MLKNVQAREDLLGFARSQVRSYERKTVRPTELDESLATGWVIQRENKSSFRLGREKSKPDLLESRVWTLFYRMGFTHLSGPDGAVLSVTDKGTDGPGQQIDVVALDDEIGLAVECKTRETPKKDTRFSEKLAKHASIRKRFAKAVGTQFQVEPDRHVATLMFTWDYVLRDPDKDRAKELGVVLFDERELEYYEALVNHLGSAARYQLLADVFRGRRIKGLEIRVPALRTRMGSRNCFTFSVRPDYLLKVAYIAHRAKGKAVDIDAYQRMLSKYRLKRISEFITNDGVFPTNIVINLEGQKYLQFDRGKQEGDGSGGVFGWLTLKPAYGAAWIIDGQHRLFAYSGHPRASTSFLNVLAFEALPAPAQTQLFVDINSEQRRVKRSLLVELDSTLKWDSEDEDKRVHAVISKAGMALDEDPLSPLHDRVLLADVKKTQRRCVSLTAITAALSKPGFYVIQRKKGITKYGPLWRDDPSDCRRRTSRVLTRWLSVIAESATEWWNLGAEEGGGLAMNDGVTVCINMLRSVFEHLGEESDLSLLDDEDLAERMTPYAVAVGRYFARLTEEERRSFRQQRGVEGQTTGTKLCQAALREEFSTYEPEGLDDWIERGKANTNLQGQVIIGRLETKIQDRILAILRDEFSVDEDAWWFEGVPKAVRKKIDDRINEADGGKREESFDLLHYEATIKYQWELLKPVFCFGEGNVGKDRGTAWLRDVNAMRNKVMHSSRRDYLSFEELGRLQEHEDWLDIRLAEV